MICASLTFFSAISTDVPFPAGVTPPADEIDEASMFYFPLPFPFSLLSTNRGSLHLSPFFVLFHSSLRCFALATFFVLLMSKWFGFCFDECGREVALLSVELFLATFHLEYQYCCTGRPMLLCWIITRSPCFHQITFKMVRLSTSLKSITFRPFVVCDRSRTVTC